MIREGILNKGGNGFPENVAVERFYSAYIKAFRYEISSESNFSASVILIPSTGRN